MLIRLRQSLGQRPGIRGTPDCQHMCRQLLRLFQSGAKATPTSASMSGQTDAASDCFARRVTRDSKHMHAMLCGVLCPSKERVHSVSRLEELIVD